MIELDAGGKYHVPTTLTPSAATVPLDDAAFLRAVLEAIPAFVVRVDPEQRIQYINHLRAGVTLEQVIGRSVYEFIAPEDRTRYDEAAAHAFRTGEPCSYAARGSHDVSRAGAAHYECHIVPIENGDGRRALCVVATDVSAELQHANELEQSEEKLRLAVEATGLGLWSWNPATDEMEWNQRLREITGYEPMPSPEFIGRVVHPEDRAALFEEQAAVRAGRPKFVEHRIVRADGEVRWLLPCGKITKIEDGRVTMMIGGMLDVTAQRKTAEQLRLAQKLDVIGSMTTGIAHNFNNMLAIIQPALELALDVPAAHAHVPAQARAHALEEALHATRRASELVGQLMAFAGQRKSPAHSTLDLAELIERCASMCERMFERRSRIETSIRARPAQVSVDPLSIEQVIVNLLINARDAVVEAEHCEPRIVVELSAARICHPDGPSASEQDFFRIQIEDNGVGMDDQVKQRLFEPFFTTKTPGKGTGLGLATSDRIVRDAGGFMTIESQAGNGTRVSVFLPPSAAERRVRTERPSLPSSARRGTILVVDDEAAVRRVVELVLCAHGHRVHLAADGQAAVAQLDAGLCPDLILLDHSMPGWPARVTLAEIRKRHAQLPVVFFTGHDVTGDERSQVQDVLYKPLANEALAQAVQRWLELRSE